MFHDNRATISLRVAMAKNVRWKSNGNGRTGPCIENANKDDHRQGPTAIDTEQIVEARPFSSPRRSGTVALFTAKEMPVRN